MQINRFNNSASNLVKAVLILALCLVPAAAFAEELGKGAVQVADKVNYTIKKGDTLWDISSGRLKDPFLWKKIWALNPYVKNPDLIFPGRILIIPGELMEANAKSSAEQGADDPEHAKIKIIPEKIIGKQLPIAKRNYLVSEDTLINSGYISEIRPTYAGKITTSPEQKTVVGRGDFVFTDVGGPKYYIVSAPERIFHPITKDMIGYLVRIKGILESAGTENGYKKALIRDAYTEVMIGDSLVEYYSIDLPLAPAAERRPLVTGVVAMVHNGSNVIGVHGVAYLDKGTAHGIQIGDLFTVISGEKPNIPIGTFQIISVREKTSVAVVKKASREIAAGDTFKN